VAHHRYTNALASTQNSRGSGLGVSLSSLSRSASALFAAWRGHTFTGEGCDAFEDVMLH
jgi:hypothetical protein